MFPTLKRQSIVTPISLTSCLAKVIEGFTHRRLLEQLRSDMDPRQYARHGLSTTHLLIYLKQAIHETVDSGNCSARIFYADVTRGFDIIDHNTLLNELDSKNRENITQAVIETSFYHRFIDEILDI